MNMLVLTRKSEEKIVIGKKKQIVITILKIQGDKVSIGIEADKETPIYRNELLLKDVEKNNQKSVVTKNSIASKEIAKELQMEIKEHSSEPEPALEASKDS